jgi:gamma-glutamyltranspeptidase
MVPGFLAGVSALHDRFGSLPRTAVFEPALYFAREGFELNYVLGYGIDMRKSVLDRLPETRAILTSDDGDWYRTGDWFRQPVLEKTLQELATAGSHSDSIVVVDEHGNVAAVTHTINTPMWGETGLFVDGISIPDAANFQQERIARTGPGKRLPEEACPAIVFDGEEVAIVSSAVGVVHHRTVSVLYPMLSADAPISEAFREQGVLLEDYGVFSKEGIVARVVEGEYSAELLDEVRSMGLQVSEVPEAQHQPYRGYWVGIQRDPTTGTLEGMTSMYLNGAVIGL